MKELEKTNSMNKELKTSQSQFMNVINSQSHCSLRCSNNEMMYTPDKSDNIGDLKREIHKLQDELYQLSDPEAHYQ